MCVRELRDAMRVVLGRRQQIFLRLVLVFLVFAGVVGEVEVHERRVRAEDGGIEGT